MADIQQKLQEERALKALRARRRFKAIVRHVIYNLYWLQDDDSDSCMESFADGHDIKAFKRMVSRATKKKHATGILTLREKAILRKPSSQRTEEEKRRINKFVGGLKCFRRFPEEVQFELVSSTYFEYYGPNRVVIRQDDEAHAMFFLLTGEVSVTQTTFDNIANEYVTAEVGRITSGNIFGEVSLLHDVRRTATVSTLTPCELLALKREDFNKILKTTIMAIWQEVKESMKKFSYFDDWSDTIIRECCILSKIRTFEANQVILGDDVSQDTQTMVYFIIEGSVSIVESLFVEEVIRNGRKTFRLFELPESEISELKPEEDDLKSISNIRHSKIHTSDIPISRSIDIRSLTSQSEFYRRGTGATNTAPKSTQYSLYLEISKWKTRGSSAHIFRLNLPTNVHVRFMQVCVIGEKGTFMDNETLQYRRVISQTPLKLLMVPAYWLMTRNKGNIWNRVTQYLYRTIPTRDEVFNAYLEQHKWNLYKKKLVHDILRTKKFVNNTTIHDVPYSIRAFHTET